MTQVQKIKRRRNVNKVSFPRMGELQDCVLPDGSVARVITAAGAANLTVGEWLARAILKALS